MDPEDGGLLQLGEGDIDDMGFITKDIHVHIGFPESRDAYLFGTSFVTRWFYQVTAISTDKPRYTLIGQFLDIART